MSPPPPPFLLCDSTLYFLPIHFKRLVVPTRQRGKLILYRGNPIFVLGMGADPGDHSRQRVA
jgi:hypothetical protein